MKPRLRTIVPMIALALALPLAFLGGCLHGEYTMLAKVIKGAYASASDQALLRKYHFPYPFLRYKVEQEGLTSRDQIHSAMRGYVQYQAGGPGTCPAPFADIYTYGLGFFGKVFISVYYDPQGQFLRMDECGSALLLG